MMMNKSTWFAVALAAIIVTTAAPVFAQGSYVDPFTLKNRAPGKTIVRDGDVSVGAAIRTDERYNKGGLFSGPRGWVYWNYLADPKGYQNPNLWPDKRPTYFFGEMEIPAGTELTVRGRFPHVRYFKFSIYVQERNTFVAETGGSIAGINIEPDPGSTNPYRVGADRDAKPRNFTIRILAKDAPANAADRAKNTVYLGNQTRTIFGGFRMYVSDRGYDGAGWGPADGPSLEGPGVTSEATLADGTKLVGDEVVKRIGKLMGDAPPPVTADDWYKLVNNKANNPCMTPATAPACADSQFFLFTGMKDAVYGAFMKPAERAKVPVAKQMEGGGDPTTAYIVNYISRKFGPLYVFRAKLPTFPNTWANTKIMPDGQVQYWSVATMATFTNGSLWDGVFDMQVPVDTDGYYTIVVSRPEDRPKNATAANGITWLDWGAGEGLGDPRNRKDWGALLMRYMVPQKDWQYSPLKARSPDELASVMGPYYPRGYYTTKAEFEAKGPKKMIGSMPPAKAEDKTVKSFTFTSTRDMRYCEILVATKDGIQVYNTTGVSDCPAQVWNTLDVDKIKTQFGAATVQKNGPHFWLMDTNTVSMGEKASLAGIEARWVARLDPALLKKEAKGTAPYQVFTPKKTQKMVYAKGKPVYELVDANGNVYVMQAHDEQFPIESLPKLGQQMKKLPKGWQYRTRTLTEDLVMDLGPGQTIYAVGDEFHQYYTRIPKTK